MAVGKVAAVKVWGGTATEAVLMASVVAMAVDSVPGKVVAVTKEEVERAEGVRAVGTLGVEVMVGRVRSEVAAAACGSLEHADTEVAAMAQDWVMVMVVGAMVTESLGVVATARVEWAKGAVEVRVADQLADPSEAEVPAAVALVLGMLVAATVAVAERRVAE